MNRRTPAPLDEKNLTDDMSVWFFDVPHVIQDFDHHKFAFFGLYGDLWIGVYRGNAILLTCDIVPDMNSVNSIIEQVKECVAEDDKFMVDVIDFSKSSETYSLMFKFYFNNGNE